MDKVALIDIFVAEDRKLICEECGEKVNQVSWLIRHIREKHFPDERAYVVKHYLNGKNPICEAPGCKEEAPLKTIYSYKRFCQKHQNISRGIVNQNRNKQERLAKFNEFILQLNQEGYRLADPNYQYTSVHAHIELIHNVCEKPFNGLLNAVWQRGTRCPNNECMQKARKQALAKSQNFCAWTDEDLQFLKENWGKLHSDEIAKHLGATNSSVRHKASRLKLKSRGIYDKRTYEVDDNFFSTLNIENCYWAGFLASDGCKKDGKNAITFALKKSDKSAVEAFKEQVKFTGPLHEAENSATGCFYVQITSQQWVKDLKEHFNIVVRKSLILQPPNIEDPALKDAFIVGYIDGDGCISFDKGYIQIQILGTKEVTTWFRDRFDEILEKHDKERTGEQIIKNENIYVIKFKGSRAKIILDHLKKCPVPHVFERKWDQV